MIILFNVFNDATVPLLFYKIERNCWPVLKSFLEYLDRLPPNYMSEIESDPRCLEELNKI